MRRWWLFRVTDGPSSGLIAAAGVLGCACLAAIPAQASEHGPTLCPSRMAFGLPCPGCGMVRATTYLLHGDIPTAWHFNPFVFVVIGFLLYLVARVLLRLVRGLPMRALAEELTLRAFLPVAAVWMAWGVLRIVFTATGRWPNIA